MTFSTPRFELHTLSQHLRYARTIRHEESARVSGMLAEQERRRAVARQREADEQIADARRAAAAVAQQEENDFRAAAAQRACTFDADTGRFMPDGRSRATVAIRPAAIRAFHRTNNDSVRWWNREPTVAHGSGRTAQAYASCHSHDDETFPMTTTQTTKTTEISASWPSSARLQQLARPKATTTLPPVVLNRVYTGWVPITATRRQRECRSQTHPLNESSLLLLPDPVKSNYCPGRDRDRARHMHSTHTTTATTMKPTPSLTKSRDWTAAPACALAGLTQRRVLMDDDDAPINYAGSTRGATTVAHDARAGRVGVQEKRNSTTAMDADVDAAYKDFSGVHDDVKERDEGAEEQADEVMSIFSHGSSNAPLAVLGVSHLRERATKAKTMARLLRRARVPEKVAAEADRSLDAEDRHFAHMSAPQLTEWLVRVQQPRRIRCG